MTRHGEVRERRTIVDQHPAALWFEAPNGEGLCCVHGRVDRYHVEARWCSKCRDWIWLKGELDVLAADYVGCLRCSTPWPKGGVA